MNPEHVELPRHVRASQVQTILGGISRVTLTQLVRDGVLPPPIKLTAKLHLWDLDDINRVIAQRRRDAA